jgi:hypothetical protein
MIHVPKFPAETPQILEYDLGCIDQDAKDSPFHVMGLVRLEM